MHGDALDTTGVDGLRAAWDAKSCPIRPCSGKSTSRADLWPTHGGIVHPDGCQR